MSVSRSSLTSLLSPLTRSSYSPPCFISSRLAAVFPLVDIDWDPHLGSYGDTPRVPTMGVAGNNFPAGPSVGGLDSQRCSADPADPSCAEVDTAAAAAAASAPPSAGFSLQGFLRVELVGLEEAEVTFRPGEPRRAALVAEKEQAAEAERKVK